MPAWLDLATTKQPSYQLDRNFYDRIHATKVHRELVDKFVIAPYSGRGFPVNKGQAFRVIEETGPQIGAAAFWNAHDPRESFIAGRTMAADACFIQRYTQLWSDVPWFRPMVTCACAALISAPVRNAVPRSARLNARFVRTAHVIFGMLFSLNLLASRGNARSLVT